jgi:histidyl-tRNA synthetase
MNPFVKEEKKRTYIDVEHILPRIRYEGPHKRGIEIADFYGFRLLRPVKIARDDREARGPAERIALIRHFLEEGLDGCTQPVHLCHTVKVPYRSEIHLRLDVLGTEKSIAEALLIHTALMILKEHGFENLVVAVNSIGGKNSAEQYLKEFTTYCRTYLNEFDEHCREALKDDPLKILTCENERCRELLSNSPQSVAFLTESSREQFYELLEGLEALDIPYRIDTRLVGEYPSISHTLFEIREEHETDDSEQSALILARGERYDMLARKAGLGRSIPATGVVLMPNRLRSSTEHFNPYKTRRPREPKAYLVHLGLPAKRRTLRVLELLRGADIPVMTLLAEESLADQLQLAEFLAIPVVIIIGHKEFVDGSAIVRHQETRSQESVPWTELPHYLKRLIRA